MNCLECGTAPITRKDPEHELCTYCLGETPLTATPFTGDTGAGITRDREPVDLSGSTAREQLQQ